MVTGTVGLALALCAAQVFAEEKEPVVLVWGEHLAAANAREAPGTRNYRDNIARALDAVGVRYAKAKDSDLPGGGLEGHKFAIFPYNSGLTDEEHAAIRRFVEQGGKLVKIGARLTRHARRLILQMAEVAITRDLFAQILDRIRSLSPVPT